MTYSFKSMYGTYLNQKGTNNIPNTPTPIEDNELCIVKDLMKCMGIRIAFKSL